MTKYSGHKNRNHWNVALWIGNDEGLYRYAIDCIKRNKTKDDAAREFLENVGAAKTPDGVVYTFTTVRAALVGLE